MGIIWKKLARDAEGNFARSTEGREIWVVDRETHKGLVMGASWTRTVQAMSDVYCDASYVQVWNPEKGVAETLCLGYHFECSSEIGYVDCVDIDPKILESEALRIKKENELREVERKIQEEKDAEFAAEQEVKAVAEGVNVVVVRGRKVPKGTTGTVFWMKEGRIGFKNDTNTFWTAVTNVEAIVKDVKPGEVPPGGWIALANEKRKAKEVLLRSYPAKGDLVKHDSGVKGRVFWIKESRVGVKLEGAPKNSDALWCDAWEVDVLNDDGTFKSRATKPVAPPVKNPLSDLPAPLCDIRKVVKEQGSWNAYDSNGKLVIRLPEDGAKNILKLLAGS